MPTRRNLLKALGAGAVAAALPRLALADAKTDARLVLVILRGAADGLALAPPWGDSSYRAMRGALALAAPGSDGGALDVDGFFGLHPSLERTHAMLREGEALVVHAVASPYRARSHFDGQDVLENGALSAGERRDGWLNRALANLDGRWQSPSAIALAHATPLVLRGEAPTSGFAPSRLPGTDEDTLDRLRALYAPDPLFSERLEQARKSQAIAGELSGMNAPPRRGGAAFATTMKHAARFLTAEDGPRIAVAELGGWDTHANQGAASGRLANQFATLDRGLAELRDGLGPAWQRTVALVVTEFGRTVRVNGTRGTDHGTGGAALALGGALAGGRVRCDWPGLGARALHEGRDLRPTSDLRSLFKTVLAGHLGMDRGALESEVFPDSAGAELWQDLFRTA